MCRQHIWPLEILPEKLAVAGVAASRHEYAWLTGCSLGVDISGRDAQFHSASVMVNYSGLKKATAAAEGHGAPSFSSATSTDM